MGRIIDNKVVPIRKVGINERNGGRPQRRQSTHRNIRLGDYCNILNGTIA